MLLRRLLALEEPGVRCENCLGGARQHLTACSSSEWHVFWRKFDVRHALNDFCFGLGKEIYEEGRLIFSRRVFRVPAKPPVISSQATGVTKDTGFKVSFQNGQAQQTFVNNFRIIGTGQGNNFLVHEVAHITINAKGIMTALHDNLSVVCK